MIQKDTLKFNCAADMVKYRFVTVTKATNTVAYTSAGAAADGITVGDEDNLVIEVLLLNSRSQSFFFDALGTIAVGAEVEVSTNGTGITKSSGITVCYAYDSAVSGSICTGYNTAQYLGSTLSTVGVANTGTTAVEEGTGDWHKTTLTVSTTLPAIAGGANLAVGKLLYTLPAGNIAIKSAYINLDITQSEGNITADTPDGGLGTVIGSGVVATLDGTATFENILTGQTFNDCNGTNEVAMVDTLLLVKTADAHTIHFNVADGWAASGDAAAALAGTVVLEWINLD